MSTTDRTGPITSAVRRTLGADQFARVETIPHCAQPICTGHHRLPDGCLVRVDIELGRWVGRLYTPEMEVKTQIVGTDNEVHSWADTIAA